MERVKSVFLKFAGYLIPLIQSLPPLGVWTSLMTLPVATYLITMFANLPLHLPQALSEFFHPFLIPEKALIMLGIMILVYSAAHLRMKRKEGLVASGPYRLVRHPQYLGMILLSLGLTSWSVWILNNTFGVGFLNQSQTIGVWFIELFAYILLANVEEHYLYRNYGEAFENYRSQIPFFIPFLRTNRKYLDILVSILIPAVLLYVIIQASTRAVFM